MAMTQMNVRIDDALRVEGNLALKQVGRSPSRTVRDVWAFAARCRDNPQKLERALRFLDDDPLSPTQKEKLDAVQGTWAAMAEGAKALGIVSTDTAPAPYEELKDRAYRERFAEGWSA